MKEKSNRTVRVNKSIKVKEKILASDRDVGFDEADTSTLSKAAHTMFKPSKKSSPKIISVSGATLFS